jgi:glycosyltransferase involved in cell wall biosynthesis
MITEQPLRPTYPHPEPVHHENDPWISVLVPAYNREATLAACVGSVLASNYTRLEIIIADNGSTDRTAEVARRLTQRDSRVRLISHASNLGPLPNWRSCLDAARHPLIHWLWSDDWIEPSFYRRMVDGMRRDGASMAMCAARIWWEDAGWQRIMYSLSDQPRTGREVVKLCLDGFRTPVSPAAALLPTESVRRHFTDSVPVRFGIDCNKRAIGCDALMILGSAWEASQVYYCPEPLVVFRAHGGSITVSSNWKLVQAHYAWARLHWTRGRSLPLRWKVFDYGRLLWRYLPI